MGDTPPKRQDHRMWRMVAVIGVWVFIALLILLCAYAVTVGLLDRLT